MSNRNHDELRIQVKKTTPENVREAHEGLFHATMNLPAAAAHCGMSQKEMKMTFWEYLKYHAADYEIPENTIALPRREESCSE
jgi:hypothetical protein